MAQTVENLESKVYTLYCQSFGGVKDNWFTLDSTVDPSVQYQVREQVMKKILLRETISYSLTSHLVTNTIVAVEFAEKGGKSAVTFEPPWTSTGRRHRAHGSLI